MAGACYSIGKRRSHSSKVSYILFLYVTYQFFILNYILIIPINYLIFISQRMRSQNQQKNALAKTHEKVMSSFCDACFVSFKKVAPKRIQEGLEILFCSKCQCKVHKSCYDFEANLTVINQKMSQFLCDVCQKEELKGKACIICEGTQGALKEIDQNQVVHIYCALTHNQIEVLQYYPAITFKKSVFYQETSASCEICSHKNAQDFCAEESCKKKVHSYCAKKAISKLEEENDDPPKSWNHHISVGNNGTFDLSEELIPFEIFSEEIEENLKGFEELEISLEGKQESKVAYYKEYFQEMKKKRRAWKKLKRGGFSYSTCPQHEHTMYCVCTDKVEGEMVQCDCCFEWYHPLCIKLEEVPDTFICRACNNFYDLKRKIIDEVRFGKSDNYEINRVELPMKISIMDLMWIMRVIDTRVRDGQTSKMLKQLVKYPLKSSSMSALIRFSSRNKLTALTDDCLAQYFRSQKQMIACRPRPVLALDETGKPITLLTNVQYNQRLRKYVELAVEIIQRKRLSDPFVGVVAELDFKEHALSDSYEKIIELSKVEQNYQQVSILKQKAQAYSFLDIIKKINSEQLISFEQLQNSLQKALKVDNLPEYLVHPLREKFKQAKVYVDAIINTLSNDAENAYKINLAVEDLSKIKIEPPLQYLEYKLEKGFIQRLYLEYMKHEGMKMEEEQSIATQIQNLLSCESIKPSQELVDIMNSMKPVIEKTIWKGVNEIIHKFSKLTIEFELKDIVKRKNCKQQKLISLMQKAQDLKLHESNEEIKELYLKWSPIKAKFDEILSKDLTDVDELSSLSEESAAVNELLTVLQNFSIRIQDQLNKKSFNSLIKYRKQEIQQLMILFTESILKKNPLSLPKILSTLPKNNNLIKDYLALKKEQTQYLNKFTTILAKISSSIESFKNDPKKQRKDQIRENCEKPTLTEITQFLQVLQSSKIDMHRQIKELTRIVNNSLEIASKVKKYCVQKGEFLKVNNQEQLSLSRKQIDELRKKVLNNAEVNLKSELLELYHAQICNRMRAILLSPNLELEKINTLLKFAEEEGLTHLETYQSLKDKFETKNQKYKEVGLIKNYQQVLFNEAAKDNSITYGSLFLVRKNLALPPIHATKTNNFYIDELEDRNRSLRSKIELILSQKPNKWDFNETKAIYLEALKNPFEIPEIYRLHAEMSDAAEFFKKWKDLGKAYTSSHPIFLDYQNLSFSIEEIETILKQLKASEQNYDKLNHLVGEFSEGSRLQIEEILENIQQNMAIKDTDLCFNAQLKYLQYWTKMITFCRVTEKKIPYEKIKKILVDSYYLLQKLLKKNIDLDQYSIKEVIEELQRINLAIKNSFKNVVEIEEKHFILEKFIDVEDLWFEVQAGLDIEEEIIILKPFADLSKFKSKSLSRSESKNREDVNSLKRTRQKFEEVNRFDSQKFINIKIDSSESQIQNQTLPNTVTDNQRKKIKEIFLKNIKKNNQLKKYGDCENQVKMLENQIFGEWHNDIIKYFETSEEFQKLFIKLIACPHISNKLIKKKFQFKFIQLLVTNLAKIDELEIIMVNKLKQQEQERTFSKISQESEEKGSKSYEDEKVNVIDLLASGRMDESVRLDLKKQMKMIKESHHKKKKSHSKHRSRSRSPDAKFSSESQKELPSYIQNEYNSKEDKTQNKIEIVRKVELDEPMMFDPEEDQHTPKENAYPKGTIFKIKECEVELFLKKKGKVDMKVSLWTEEEHKKIITEYVDPNFTNLVIRKEKSDSEIIQYINKSKKKYRYLTGWFEAVNILQNENLKEMSIEANEKHKVFGWQNEHIKMHIMSIKQAVQVNKLSIPSKLSCESSQCLQNERMVFILQYPERIYEIKDIYQPFQLLDKITNPIAANVPVALLIPPMIQMDPTYYNNFKIPSIVTPLSLNLPKPLLPYDNISKKQVYQGWESDTTTLPISPYQGLPTHQGLPTNQLQNNNPYNIIRVNLGFGYFSPIQSDQEDNPPEKQTDLASNLLNSLSTTPNPARTGFYNGGYPAFQPNRPQDNRWMGYNGQQQVQSQIYNPMAPKYIAPINPMYKNPMMFQNQASNPPIQSYQNQVLNPSIQPNPKPMRNMNPMGGQPYYRPNDQSGGYDQRYYQQ